MMRSFSAKQCLEKRRNDHITRRLEPLNSAFLASPGVLISSQSCGSNSRGFVFFVVFHISWQILAARRLGWNPISSSEVLPHSRTLLLSKHTACLFSNEAPSQQEENTYAFFCLRSEKRSQYVKILSITDFELDTHSSRFSQEFLLSQIRCK